MERKFAIIGHPLGHSLSPQIHTRLFELAEMPFTYTLEDIPPEELENKRPFLDSLGGYNITIPHKIPIIKFCDRLDKGAERYGSVNCIMNGSETIGYNTDVIGFTKSITQLGASLNSKVCLLGCGGVGRMMAIETAYEGGDLTIAVRSDDLPVANGVAEEIRHRIPNAKVQVITLDKVKGGFDLMINSTPLGMFPKTEAMAVAPEGLENVKYLFDAVYNPRRTMLMNEAEKRGARVMGGMAMLVLQAVAAHEIWDNSAYKTEDITALIEEMEKLV